MNIPTLSVAGLILATSSVNICFTLTELRLYVPLYTFSPANLLANFEEKPNTREAQRHKICKLNESTYTMLNIQIHTHTYKTYQ